MLKAIFIDLAFFVLTLLLFNHMEWLADYWWRLAPIAGIAAFVGGFVDDITG